jgi:uncharacterized coiled-coil protein SlyX
MSNAAVQTTGQNAPAPQSQAASAAALGGGGEQVQDWGAALAAQEAALNQNGNLIAQQGSIITALREELNRNNQQMTRVQKAFSGEPDKKLSKVEERGQRLSGLTTMLRRDREESLRQGLNGMPHTVRIGEELAAYAAEADAEKEALAAQVRALTERLDRQQNPMFAGLERAAFYMEGMVDEAIEQLYGKGADTKNIRAAQYDAITKMLNDEIRDIIKSEDRAALLKIQRSPDVMRRMVNHFVKQVVPPKVREMIEAEELAAQPDDPSELLQVLNEAKQKYNAALVADDNRQADFWSNQIDEIRQKFLAAQYGGKKQGGKPSINAMVGSYLGGGIRR